MVAAAGRGVRWPAVATGVLVTGAPIGNAPAGSVWGAISRQSATRRRKLPWGSRYQQKIRIHFAVGQSTGMPVDHRVEWHAVAGIKEALGGHPKGFKPEQPRRDKCLWGAVGGHETGFADD